MTTIQQLRRKLLRRKAGSGIIRHGPVSRQAGVNLPHYSLSWRERLPQCLSSGGGGVRLHWGKSQLGVKKRGWRHANGGQAGKRRACSHPRAD